ncbi:MAG: PAS domain S-box protein [candidate division WOR-3 bacterium]
MWQRPDANNILKHYQFTIDKLHHCVFVCDSKNQIVHWNKAFEKIALKSPKKFASLKCWEIVHGLKHQPPNCINLKAKNSKHQETAEMTIAGRSYQILSDPVFDRNGNYLGSVHILSDITSQKQRERAIVRREKILEALANAGELFIKSENYESVIPNVLAQIGQAAEVSRVYIFEKHISPNGRLLVSQRFEWVNKGITPQIDNPLMQNFDVKKFGFGRWEKILTKGQVIFGKVKDLPINEQKILSAQQIRSIVVMPIFVKKDLWGFIGFDECRFEREWTQIEIDTLKAAASLLGTVIENAQKEQIIRESEIRYRTLVENANDAILLLDLAGNIITANKKAQELSGLSKKILPCNIAELGILPPKSVSIIQKNLKLRLANKPVKPYQIEFYPLKGSPKIVEVNASLVRDEQGKAIYDLAIIRDITDWYHTHNALKQSEEKFRSLVENVNVGVYRNTPDPKGRFIEANTAMCRMLGYNIREIKKLSVSDLYQNPADRKKFIKKIKKYGVVRNEEVHLKKKDGTPIIASVTARAHRDKSGKIDWIDGVIEDITERKTLEQEQQQKIQQTIRFQTALLKLSKLKLTDFDTAIRKILETDANTIDVERVSFWSFNKDQTKLVCDDLYLKSKNIHTKAGTLQVSKYPNYFKELRCGRVIAADNAQKDRRTAEFTKDYLVPYNISSMMDTPVRLHGQVVGVVCHEHTGQLRKWTLEEQSFASSIADLISLKLEEKALQTSQQIIKESEEKYRSLVENINVGIYRSTLTGRFVAVNKAMARIFGYASAQELKQVSVFKLYQNVKDREAFINKINKQGVVKNEELYLKKKDGTPIIASVTARVHRDKSGKIDWIDGVIENITERKNAELALRNSEERYRTIFEMANDAICIFDKNGVAISGNKKLFDLTGLTAKQLGLHISQYPIFPKKSLELVQQKMRQRFSGKEVGPYEVEIHPINGTPKIVEVNASLIRDTNGAIVGDLAIIRDVTERKRYEIALYESEQKFRTLVENIQDIIILRDANDNVKYINPACKTILGYSQEELMEKSPDVFHSLIYHQDRDFVQNMLKRVNKGIPCFNLEYRIMTKDGKIKWVSHSRTPILENNQVKMTIGVIRDITAQKETALQLQAAKEAAEAANRAKTAFLANMSHELRTPMHSILGFTDILMEKEENNNKERKEFLSIIKNSSDKLLHIINELLDLSRIESGKMTVEQKEFSIFDIANRLKFTYQPKIAEKHLQFKLILSRKLPKKLVGDPIKIEQILTNLLDNAIKFTHQGKIELYFGFLKPEKLKKKQGILEYYVKDTGVGIEPERMKHLFEQYLQADAYLTRITPGARLGLAIVKQLVDLMHGTIAVKSKLGKGTKFHIKHPIKLV